VTAPGEAFAQMLVAEIRLWKRTRFSKAVSRVEDIADYLARCLVVARLASVLDAHGHILR
jgi:hypothetical protein